MRTVRVCVEVVIASGCALLCASCGPHMNIQPSIQPYEQRMPNMPAGSVPTSGTLETLTVEQSKLATNPLSRTPTNLRNGEIYYGYYCLMCHGSDGKGNGPVGQSYVPKPTDLTSPAVVALTDGEIYYRMLNGAGHAPVMNQTVLRGQRWPIVMYVRALTP